MAITPTQQGALFGGAGLWTLGWLTFFKVDKIPLIRRWVNKDKTCDWINENKSMTLLLTEFVNVGGHGVGSPESVIFALGGTIVNAFMVCLFIPFRQKRLRKRHRSDLCKGIA